ncbi:protocatechuate 3,4-dioxygenase subunit alpha [Paeniglutamicibacter antarcticus]|uniref:Protocatechuate 3,4-dioxygenase subunit alpha n=1 Tax=Arthrobacter terrae TaxID=2935737 RepID=A0A931CGF6_9MICC|nr:protocatechuate 3,4-dioxygenase subunit alpha [Arthrobacter terrae]MBG0737898.1 protocatechuate 3,4-dioxygenase subunit alpha [Arthrobacter terrae]
MPEQTGTEATRTIPKLPATPGQTIGPFFEYALPYAKDGELVPQARPGALRLHGTVYDGQGDPIPDALLEIWQADEDGTIVQEPGSLVRDGYTFTGWGRESVDNTGSYTFTTLNPGATKPGSAPFIAVVVFARGLLNKLHTRVYLPEDTAALAQDPVLSALPEDRRDTLIATRESSGDLLWDIRLQGPGETVFLSFAEA